jgi:hypothetical protein
MGGTIRMDQDGKNRAVYVTGLRNPVDLEWDYSSKRRSPCPALLSSSLASSVPSLS